MSAELHLVSTAIGERAYGRWAERPAYADTDPSYRIHCLLSETFGGGSPLSPFRLMSSPGRQRSILAYSPMEAGLIVQTAERVMSERAGRFPKSVLSLGELRTVRVPLLQTGQKLAVSVLAVPHRRMDGSREMDAHGLALRRARESGLKPPTREASYTAWMTHRIERTGGATLSAAWINSWERGLRTQKQKPPSRADNPRRTRRRSDRPGPRPLHRTPGPGNRQTQGLRLWHDNDRGRRPRR